MKTHWLFSFLLLATAFTAKAQLPPGVPSAGLIAYYGMNGNANDLSGNNLNGTVHGATPAINRFGNPNSAYQFDGVSNYIEIANNALLNIPGAISISLWFDPYNRAGNGRLVDKATWNQSDAYMLDISGASINRGARMIVAGQTLSQPTTTTFINADSAWYHLVATYDLSNVRIYVNGVLDTTVAVTGNSITNTNPLRFGANSILSGNWFKGKLDDIAIYNRALTPQEVTQLYYGSPCSYADTTHVTIYDSVHVVVHDTIFHSVTIADTLAINVNLTGIAPPNNTNLVNVYPNPTHNHLVIDNGNLAAMTGYTIKITNALGQAVFNQVITQQSYNIDLNTWTGNGVYILYVIDQQQTVKSTKAIVLQ